MKDQSIEQIAKKKQHKEALALVKNRRHGPSLVSEAPVRTERQNILIVALVCLPLAGAELVD